MFSFESELDRRLADLDHQGLRRELRRVDSPQSTHIEVGGRTVKNFSSNDYLGLANHPALKEAAIRAVGKFGAGAGASRLICGSLSPFHELEESLAVFKGTEAALTFATGHAAAMGTIGALLGRDDLIILDKLVHASIVDAARLSGAKLRVFDHNDLNDLEEILKWADRRPAAPTTAARPLIVTESIFSMDGDAAPLRELVALKEKHGAWLMLDEAHATGITGRDGRGWADETGVSHRIEIQLGTLGKALGASGGFVCGARSLIDLLVNRARSFMFSTAPVPAAAAAAAAAIALLQSGEGAARRGALWQRIKQFSPSSVGAIVPVGIGDERKALAVSEALRLQDIFVPAIRYPTVARGQARLRVTLNADHTAGAVTELQAALKLLNP